jgi:hypothetical protein
MGRCMSESPTLALCWPWPGPGCEGDSRLDNGVLLHCRLRAVSPHWSAANHSYLGMYVMPAHSPPSLHQDAPSWPLPCHESRCANHSIRGFSCTIQRLVTHTLHLERPSLQHVRIQKPASHVFLFFARTVETNTCLSYISFLF